jgi:dinuclear metal center YbgI/SA1388 family protein
VSATVKQIIDIFEQLAPKRLAMEGDKIGLHIGNPQKRVNKILVTLDSSAPEVIDEAVQVGADLVIAHHALIYRKISNIRTDTPYGKGLAKLLAHDIAVYVAHTNLDIAEGGVNDALAAALNLKDVEILERMHNQRLKKLVVFVPVTHQKQVIAAMCQAGAGHIGNYSWCTFNTKGIGTFKPEEGTHPFIGEKGRLEEVEEVRVETIVPEPREHQIIHAMLEAHPYEEVAYDLYPLEIMGREYGIGRIGNLPNAMTLRSFASFVRERLQVPGVRVCGSLNRNVQRVAVLGGSGQDWISTAIARGADVFVTADVTYHMAQDAVTEGLSIVDPGHYGTERVVLEPLANYLRKRFSEENLSIDVVVSQVNTDPFGFVTD